MRSTSTDFLFHVIHSQAFRGGMPSLPSNDSSARDESNPCLRIHFGSEASILSTDHGCSLALAMPCLGGERTRSIHLGSGAAREAGKFTLWENAEGHRWGACVLPWDRHRREAVAREAYAELLTLTEGVHLHRLWNFVPQINETFDGEENYRRFCVGRSEAFADHFGPQAKAHMPAGSAVGIEGSALIVAFLASRDPAVHFENPLQIPAYEYPRQYGRRPPSFARGTVVRRQDHRDAFISGTAAVRGHVSAARGDLAGQISTTLEMLASLGQAMGIGADLGAKAADGRQFVVYLRHAADLPIIREGLERSLILSTDTVTYLQADICRAELLLEIEGSVRLPR